MDGAIAIGMCIGLDRIPQLAAGYDYVELGVSSALNPLKDDAEYAPTGSQLPGLTPPVRAFNLFVPGSVRLTGPDVDWDRIDQYAERATRRAAAAGASVIVVGSGGSRRVPEGYSHTLAWGQLVRMFQICADHAARNNIVMAIEPLNRGETNIINSYAEGVQLAKDVGRKEVRVLADIYHFMVESEPLDHIADAPEWLAHVHLADSERYYPGSGSYPLRRLFAILKDIGYQGMASVECRWGEDFTAESAKALAFLRELTA